MPRTRLTFETWPGAVYAIGDVHGYLGQLEALEEQILADGATVPGEKWIITLGDYIDRGPDVSGVIDHLLRPLPAGWRRIALFGNHEGAMLDYLRDPIEYGWWLMEGGSETLSSYGVDTDTEITNESDHLSVHAAAKRSIPAAHLEFISTLPIAVSLPGWIFVHAGIRPGILLDRQSDADLLLIRSPFLETRRQDGVTVVHGHTPRREPVVTSWRVCLDTHCFLTGTLTGMRVTPDGRTMLMSASGPVVPWSRGPLDRSQLPSAGRR